MMKYTEEEYVELEEKLLEKHAFYKGEIYTIDKVRS